ncbi:MAG: hypothetical protein K5685_11805 [Bacteroidales bacterium]|nr:hypothetical protein [Bacteroidales bacterium]
MKKDDTPWWGYLLVGIISLSFAVYDCIYRYESFMHLDGKPYEHTKGDGLNVILLIVDFIGSIIGGSPSRGRYFVIAFFLLISTFCFWKAYKNYKNPYNE